MTIREEIKKNEQKSDKTYNVKPRFTLNRKIKRLSTNLFVTPRDLTKDIKIKESAPICREVDELLRNYQEKCSKLQIEQNGYTIEDVMDCLKGEQAQRRVIDFIQFSREWIAMAEIKGAPTYTSAVNAPIHFIGKDELDVILIMCLIAKKFVYGQTFFVYLYRVKIHLLMYIKNVLMLSLVVCSCIFCACSDEIPEQIQLPDLPTQPIIVLYDNDVHCSIDGYPMLVSYRDECLSGTDYVSTISCGDFASGGLAGAVSKGERIVEIMNYVGYDIVTLGNHELDYGMEQMFNITEALDAPVVCANFKNVQTNTYPYPAYHIVRYGEVDVAYIGFTTTTSGTVTSLSDEQGNPLYSFMREGFYENAQYFIDEARRNGADYVIALSHLGDSEKTGGHPNSTGLIAHTVGLDAVIDGHDHHVIEKQIVNNKDGKPVLLTSSGTNFQYIGQLTIKTDGTIHSSLIDIVNGEVSADNKAQDFINCLKEDIESQGNFVIGNSEVDLMIYNADGTRIVRKQESNLGDFCADALRVFTDADIALINGGGIRANINRGNILFNDLYNVMPFGDMIATGIITGQQLLDVLEFSVSSLPAESGSFMQVSGLRFDVNPSIPSPVVKDSETSLFSYVGEGNRRVSNVEVLDKESGEYKEIELSHQYIMATLDYLILEQGASGIFNQVKPISTYWGADIEILRHYLEDSLGGYIGVEYSEPQGRIIFK